MCISANKINCLRKHFVNSEIFIRGKFIVSFETIGT